MFRIDALIRAFEPQAEMEIMKGEIGYLQRRADRTDAYQQMHLRTMSDFSKFIVANPPENLPIIDDGDAETVVEEQVRQTENPNTISDRTRCQNTAAERPNQPAPAPMPVVPPRDPPGTPTDYNYDEKDEHLSDGEIRDTSTPSTPKLPKSQKQDPGDDVSVVREGPEERSVSREGSFYSHRGSLFDINCAKARDNATRRNRIPNPCRDMRKPGMDRFLQHSGMCCSDPLQNCDSFSRWVCSGGRVPIQPRCSAVLLLLQVQRYWILWSAGMSLSAPDLRVRAFGENCAGASARATLL